MEKPALKSAFSGFAYFLVSNNLLDEQTAYQALQQASASKIPYILHLTQQHLIDPSHIAKAATDYFGLPLLDISVYQKDLIPNDLMNIPLVQMRLALPLLKRAGYLYLAISDPTIPGLNEVKFLTGFNMRLVLVEADKLLQAIDELLNTQLMSGLGDLDDTNLDELNVSAYEEEQAPVATEMDVDNTPVVRYVNKVLLDAINTGASDIHFEPYDNAYRIRFRQDGILHKVASPPLKISNYIVARIKVMASLDISERRVPQDGRFKLMLSRNKMIDFRVSVCPTLFGEKIVMRILNTTQALQNIDGLGMEETQKINTGEALLRSQGMILVTGPTGSGKTVTLYTALGILNTMEKNISTVEDPVEIPVQGINQVHVNLKSGLTFSVALRSFLRQDPDIIMVGEIRDLETAEIAVKAAQTGHLVLSTIHTNSASEAILRLANMGVAPFNIASAIMLIIAQRLVRKLCEHCKHVVEIPQASLLKEGFKPEEIESLKIYGPGSCERCSNGYKGRMGIFEVLPISPEMGQLIMSGGNALQISELARKEGVMTLRESGLLKIRQGLTSLEEVNRVFKG